MSSAPRPFITPAPGFDVSSFAGATVVVPVVSYANVSQLCVDLAISSLPAIRRVAFLDPSDLIPFVGGAERPLEGGVVTPLEVYAQVGDEYPNVFWVQQRSPVLKNRKDEFLTRFVAWIKEAKFAKLLVLGSLDGSSRADNLGDNASKHFHLPLPRVVSIPFPALSSAVPAYAASSGGVETISAEPLPASTVTTTEGGSAAQPLLPPLPGSGLLSSLLLKLDLPGPASTAGAGAAEPVQTGVVLAYAVEGDNRADARAMAKIVDLVLDLGVERAGAGGWREPDSWDALVRGARRAEWA